MSELDRASDGLISEIATALTGTPRDRVLVSGEDPLAQALRRSLGFPQATDDPPLAIIHTSGAADDLVAACAAVADGGLVILAADPPGPVDIDLYRDVHRRGLALIGVAGSNIAPAPDESAGSGG